jgi:hypothetical protein
MAHEVGSPQWANTGNFSCLVLGSNECITDERCTGLLKPRTAIWTVPFGFLIEHMVSTPKSEKCHRETAVETVLSHWHFRGT